MQEKLGHLLSISFIAAVVLSLDVQVQASFGRVNFAAARVRATVITFELRHGFTADDPATVRRAVSRELFDLGIIEILDATNLRHNVIVEAGVSVKLLE